MGESPVVEEHDDRSAGAVAMAIEVRTRRIDVGLVDFDPLAAVHRPDTAGLVRGEDDESHPVVDEVVHHVGVHRRFR